MKELRIGVRLNVRDQAALVAIREYLRTNGRPWTNRTDAIRHALATAARAISEEQANDGK